MRAPVFPSIDDIYCMCVATCHLPLRGSKYRRSPLSMMTLWDTPAKNAGFVGKKMCYEVLNSFQNFVKYTHWTQTVEETTPCDSVNKCIRIMNNLPHYKEIAYTSFIWLPIQAHPHEPTLKRPLKRSPTKAHFMTISLIFDWFQIAYTQNSRHALVCMH